LRIWNFYYHPMLNRYEKLTIAKESCIQQQQFNQHKLKAILSILSIGSKATPKVCTNYEIQLRKLVTVQILSLIIASLEFV